MGFLSGIKQLFGGQGGDVNDSSKASKGKAQTQEYKDFVVATHPIKAEGGFRVSGTIRKDQLEHSFIRADLAYSLEDAHTLTFNKAKQAIDQLDERLFQ